jgi:hypothetical protein
MSEAMIIELEEIGNQPNHEERNDEPGDTMITNTTVGM